MTDYELHNPVETRMGPSGIQEPVFLCKSCSEGKPGMCTESPLHKVAQAQKLNHHYFSLVKIIYLGGF
jgi:hypothetical protein